MMETFIVNLVFTQEVQTPETAYGKPPLKKSIFCMLILLLCQVIVNMRIFALTTFIYFARRFALILAHENTLHDIK